MNENEVLKRLLQKFSMKLEFGEFHGTIYGKNREILALVYSDKIVWEDDISIYLSYLFKKLSIKRESE